MSIFTFSYRVASGATRSFRCTAPSNEGAVAMFADECRIVEAVTGGRPVFCGVEVER